MTMNPRPPFAGGWYLFNKNGKALAGPFASEWDVPSGGADDDWPGYVDNSDDPAIVDESYSPHDKLIFGGDD